MSTMVPPASPTKHTDDQLKRAAATYVRADAILNAAVSELGAEIINSGTIRHTRMNALEHYVEQATPGMDDGERKMYVQSLLEEAAREPQQISSRPSRGRF